MSLKVAALVPAGAAGVFIFGWNALAVIIISVATAVVTEALVLAIRKKDVQAVYDGSAVMTRRRTVNLRPLDSSAVSCCAHGPRKALWTLVNTASGLFSERIAGASGQTSLLIVRWLCYIGI